MISRPASGCGKPHRRSEEGRKRAGRADRLEWARLHRQRRRRRQGRQGPHVCARRQDTGKIVWEFYLVPKSPGDVERGPQAHSPLDASTWKTPSGSPITGGATWTSYTLDPEQGAALRARRQSGAGFRRGHAGRRKSLFRLRRRARRQDRRLQDAISRSFRRTGTIGTCPTAPVADQIQPAARSMMLVAPKDGHLYAFDLADAEAALSQPHDQGR